MMDIYKSFNLSLDGVLVQPNVIDKYTKSEYEQFAKYVKGLKDDLAAVENAILNRHISNGSIEGTNTKITLLRRIRYGKADRAFECGSRSVQYTRMYLCCLCNIMESYIMHPSFWKEPHFCMMISSLISMIDLECSFHRGIINRDC